MELDMISIIVSVAGGSFFTALVAYIVYRGKKPMEDLSAKADASTKLVASALDMVTKLESQVKELQVNDVDKERRLEKMELESRTQASLIQRLTARIELWVTWGEGIRVNWPILRLQEEPPDPPLTDEDTI